MTEAKTLQRRRFGWRGPCAPIDYSDIDPGIRRTVRWLRKFGYETTDSGDGVTKLDADIPDSLDCPHVFMRVDDARELFGAADFLCSMIEGWRGVEVPQGAIQATYDPVSGPHVLALIGFDDHALGFGPRIVRSWGLGFTPDKCARSGCPGGHSHQRIIGPPHPPREIFDVLCVPGVRRVSEIGDATLKVTHLMVEVIPGGDTTIDDIRSRLPATVAVDLDTSAWDE